MYEETRPAFSGNRLLGRFYGVSLASVFAGVVLALAIQLMLSVLGVGIGASTIEPQTEQSPFSGLGIGRAIWFFVTIVIAMYIGGWIAGHFSGVPDRLEGALHGLVTWAVTVLVAVYLLTSAVGGLISGGASLLTGLVSTTTQAAASSPQLSERVKEELRARGIDIDSLRERAQSPETQAEVESQARETGETIAGGISMAGIMSFVTLLIGSLAAGFGGFSGVPRGRRVEIPPVERAA